MCSEKLAGSFMRGREAIKRIREKICVSCHLTLKLLRRKGEERDNLLQP